MRDLDAVEEGYLSLKTAGVYHTLYFPERGWLAADLVSHLDDVLQAAEPRAAVLKLLGFTLQLSPDPPPRRGRHWIVVDLDKRLLETNSPVLRAAVTGSALADPPLPEQTLQRIHRVLDRFDFTVELFS